MAQITSITSESLQAQIRSLLPSQQGFGEDLQASNVITPIIDLTAAAQGTTTPESLQQALAFGSQTAFLASNSTVALTSTPGFYRVIAISALTGGSSILQMTDGLTTKNVWRHPGTEGVIDLDLIIFVASGITLNANASAATVNFAGSIRQVADVNGNLVNPVGFTPQ